MLGDGRGGAGLHVRRRAEFQRDPLVTHVGGEATQRRLPILRHRYVVDDPHAVPEPVRAAPLQRLPDRGKAERLAGVDREMRVLPSQVLERVEVPRRREACFGARDVEPDDAGPAVADHQLGDLARPCRMPHRREQRRHPDRPTRGGRTLLAQAKAFLDRLHHFVEREPAVQVLFRRVLDLRIDDAVGGQVLGAFTRHPDQGLAGLHDPDCMDERLQVTLQGAGVGRLDEPSAQLVRVICGQAVAGLRSQLDHRRRAEPTVEMVVQQNLRCGQDLGLRRRHNRHRTPGPVGYGR